MNIDRCFSIKNNIIRINDIINKKNYLFLGSDKNIDDIIDKINLKGISKISKKEQEELKKYLENKNINFTSINSNTILVKCLINLFDSIDTIKKKIMKYVNNNSLPNEQFLWLNNKENNILGFKYVKNENEILLIETNILNKNFKIQDIDVNYSYVDNNYEILYNFDDNISEINFINYGDYYNNYKSNIDFEKIKTFYFPNLNKKSLSFNDYKLIIEQNTNVENNFFNSLNELEDSYKFNSCYLKNIVIKNKQQNLNLQDIFRKLSVNNKIVFLKYKSNDKNEFYKIFTKPFNKKKIFRQYSNPKNYIIDYEKGFHDQILSKNQIDKWNQKTISYREKQNFRRDKELEIERKYNSYIIIKVLWKNDIYFEIEIKSNEIFVRLLMDHFFIEVKDINNILDISNNIIKSLNKSIETKVQLFNKSNMSYINCDSINMINLKNINMKKLNDYLKYYLYFIYKIEPEYKNQNSIYFKSKFVNNFRNFENIKRHFIKIKKTNPELSIENIKKEWITECKNMFDLPENESLNILTEITELISQADLNRPQIDIDIDVVFTKKTYDTENELYTYELKINNCTNLYIIESIKNIVSVIIYNFFKPKKIDKKEKKEIEISKIEVKQLSIQQEDEDFDLDDDLIDLDDNNFEENDLNEEAENINKLDLNYNYKEEDIDIDIESLLEEKDEELQEEEDKKYVELNENFFKGKSRTIRNYMNEMRQLDKKLYYITEEDKKQGFKSYVKKCQSVQMKQPLIITKNGIKNIEKRNPEAYKQLTKLEWGSSKQSKNFYICPQIWCIRDKLVLLPKDLIRNSKNKLVCRFCKGEIINSESKQIKENQTVIIRKATTNDYWENKARRKTDQPKELDGSEHHAFPSLLDPSVSPNGFCMPCCNKSRSWNFNKCMLINVDYITDLPDIDISTLKPGSIIDGFELEENDTIALKNTSNKNNIYIVTKNGGKIKEYFTKLEIKIKNGMIVTVNKGKYANHQFKIIIDNLITDIIRKKTDFEKGALYWSNISLNSELEETYLKVKGFEEEKERKSLEVDDMIKIIHSGSIYNNKEFKIIKAIYNDNYIIVQGDINIDLKDGLSLWQLSNIRFLKIENVKTDKYILGFDKFPLSENKLGQLSDELDLILNEKKKKIEKSRILNNSKLFVRKGLNQRPNVSFINSIASILDMSYKQLISKVIKNITPELFLSLNNGEIYKIFTNSVEQISFETIYFEAFIKWCYEYSDFIIFYNSYKFNNASELLLLIQTKKEKIEKRELLDEMISYLKNNKSKFNIDERYKLLLNIYYSFENYKKYWGDLNIEKEPVYVLDLLSRNNLWLNKDYNGLNIIILEQKKNKIYINCPVTESIDNIYNPKKSNCLILKYRGIYEPIIIVNESFDKISKQRILIKYNYFNDNIKYNKYLITVVKSLYELTVLKCVSKINVDIYSIYNKIKYENLQSITKNINFYNKLKNTKFLPKYLIIDAYFKGIGFQMENKMIIFTSNFGLEMKNSLNLEIKSINKLELLDFDDLTKNIKNLNKELKLEERKLNLKIKKLEKTNLSINIINTKINKIILQMNDIPKELHIQNVIINDDYIIAVILSNGMFHPIKKEKYNEKKDYSIKSEPLKLNYYLNIHENLITNESSIFNYNYYRNLEKYSCFKNNFKSFFNSKNKNLKILKDYIYDIIENPVLLISKKRELLVKIILDLSKGIVHIIPNDRNIKYNKNIICFKQKKKCKEKDFDQCYFKKTNYTSSLFINSKYYIFNISKCKLKLTKNDNSIFIYKLVSELINSYKERIDILENSTFDLLYSDNVILSDNFTEEIDKLYEKKNIYINNLLSKSMQNRFNPLKNNDITSELINILINNKKQLKLDDLDPDKYDINKITKMFPPPGSNKNNIIMDLIDNEINDNKEKSSEVNRNCNSDKIATTISTKGNVDKKDDAQVKGGPCCFPFIDIGQGTKPTEFNDWKYKLIDGRREPICATSVYSEDENSAKKDYLKTYGFAPKGTVIKKKIKPKIKQPQDKIKIKTKKKKKNLKIIDTGETTTINKRKTISGKECKIPFNLTTGKGFKKISKKINNCVIEEVEPNKKDTGEWCPIKLDEDNFAAPKNNRKIKENYDYCEDTETFNKLKESKSWMGPYENTLLVDLSLKSNIINKKPIRYLKEAVEKCSENEECLGISHDMYKNNYTLRKSNKMLTPDSFDINLKITEKNRKDSEKYRSWIKK